MHDLSLTSLALVLALGLIGCEKQDGSATPVEAGAAEGIEVSVERNPAWRYDHPIDAGEGLRDFVIGASYLLNTDFTPVADAIVAAFAGLESDQCVRIDVEGQGVARIYAEGGKVILATEDGLGGRQAAMGISATATVR